MTDEQVQTLDNVRDAMEKSPEEAANMTPRSELMLAMSEGVASWQFTQVQAAARPGVTQPQLNDMLHGRINCSRVWRTR